MSFVQNVPCFSCIFPMIAAFITAALSKREHAARALTIALVVLLTGMNAWLLSYLVGTGDSFIYVMGQFGAPWGNELRAGMLEAAIALLFCFIVLLSLLGGSEDLEDFHHGRASLFYIMVDLMLTANLALVYTNDMFTAYVFVEISTISACGLIIGKDHEFAVAAGVRYMVMSLMGSGLLLLGICFLYDITGELLMESAHEVIINSVLHEPQYQVPMIMSLAMILVGLGIKSGLWPFHSWMPQAYGYSTTTASGILSSVTSKGYIVLALKFIFRVYGIDTVDSTYVLDILMILGIIAMMGGSVKAIYQHNIRKLVAYSSVAQIGYIYMGVGMGTHAGAVGAVYHVFAHSLAKTLVFISVAGLIKASAGKKNLEKDLVGAAFRNPVAAAGYVMGTLSMIGIPAFGGFISKFLLARASLKQPSWETAIILGALALSTLMNAIYFMRVMIKIFTPGAHMIGEVEEEEAKAKEAAEGNPETELPVIERIAEPDNIVHRTHMSAENPAAKLSATENPAAELKDKALNIAGPRTKNGRQYKLAILVGSLAVLYIGIWSQPLIQIIEKGLLLFD